MLCPVCKTQTLQMAERHGIEIDYCPGCRGVWLDRGELDKIIERAGAGAAVPPPAPVQAQPAAATPPPVMHRDTRHLGQRYEDNRGQQYGHGYKKKKKDSFLSELFDF
ncbi:MULTISPECIES: zf-TFIIB domain-containing protein [Stenotrophomonas]|uniref:TFIIB-type zinc ribbon-containing protein n=1 Tax=Stenotrophomonas TaxID=40323 RepID=UPI00066EF483|nr:MULTISPECIES: zf-TFIIB domain-containing protein [Stenotrophomonas]MCV0220685.1 zf-TFIIB domain-containing protein [Stenotrophomonas sp. Ps181]MDW7599354.1 zf-TFIIB domain-containing protein [Stenotrophomonas maltophilia]HDS1598526.1 zf-TFIIB domain-containing protein [Stenotrophomonas maltophilia]